jgi:hypothetical protein
MVEGSPRLFCYIRLSNHSTVHYRNPCSLNIPTFVIHSALGKSLPNVVRNLWAILEILKCCFSSRCSPHFDDWKQTTSQSSLCGWTHLHALIRSWTSLLALQVSKTEQTDLQPMDSSFKVLKLDNRVWVLLPLLSPGNSTLFPWDGLFLPAFLVRRRHYF